MGDAKQSRLAQIRARLEAATLGPWEYDGVHPEILNSYEDGETYGLVMSERPSWTNRHPNLTGAGFDNYFNPDFDFIAHSREDMPLLLEVLDATLNLLAVNNASLALVEIDLHWLAMYVQEMVGEERDGERNTA